MSLYVFSVVFGMYCLLVLFKESITRIESFFRAQEKRDLKEVVSELSNFEQKLESGVFVTIEMKTKAEPWKSLTEKSVESIREKGGAILPTLKRFRSLATFQEERLSESQARSSGALFQAMVFLLLIPLLSLIFYFLIPEISFHLFFWISITLTFFVFSLLGVFWLFHEVDQARFGGLNGSKKNWPFLIEITIERFLARVRSGESLDTAYTESVLELKKASPELADVFQVQLFSAAVPFSSKITLPIERSLFDLISNFKSVLQLSLMEGRPSLERVETLITGFRSDYKSAVEKTLSQLATKALKPLFICLSPGVFGLLVSAVVILVKENAKAFF